MISLDNRDCEVLAFLKTQYKLNGYVPGKYDIVKELSISYKTVSKCLTRLMLSNKITYEKGKQRSIKVL